MGIGNIFGLFDAYDRKARLYPALLTLMPVLVTVLCLHRSSYEWITTITAVLIGCGVLYAISVIARNFGKRIERRQFARWGGKPTTQLLRHRDALFDPITKERIHRIISNGLGFSLPTASQEQAEPVSADQTYDSAVRWLIEQTRERIRFPLLMKENISYGFHRNMLGLKPLGLTVSIVSMLWTITDAGALSIYPLSFEGQKMATLDSAAVLPLATASVMMLIWMFGVGVESVRVAAFTYAERLLQACERLPFAAPGGAPDRHEGAQSSSVRET